MNDIEFIKTNGGIGRPAANEDPISGLILPFSGTADQLLSTQNPRQFDQLNSYFFVAKLRYAEELEQFGIREKKLFDWNDYGSANPNPISEFPVRMSQNNIVYQVQEFFRINPAGTLYLGLNLGDFDPVDLQRIQNHSGGKIRQCGCLINEVDDTDEFAHHVSHAHGETVTLETEHKPMSVVLTAQGVSYGDPQRDNDRITLTPGSAVLSNRSLKEAVDSAEWPSSNNTSVLIGCDLDPSLFERIGAYHTTGCIGACIGTISKASVHECIAWVGKFPLGLKMPGFIGGELYKEVEHATLNDLNTKRYIFVVTHTGIADNYFNDSHTLAPADSDYAYIENVRTIDKACRGIRANLLPYLNSPLRVDADTGKLDSSTVAFLETTAGKALEEMEKAGELSGYSVEIDPEQNVLATSTVEIVIRQAGVGVMRKVRVKIGFTTKLQ